MATFNTVLGIYSEHFEGSEPIGTDEIEFDFDAFDTPGSIGIKVKMNDGKEVESYIEKNDVLALQKWLNSVIPMMED